MPESTSTTPPAWLFSGLGGALLGVGALSIVDGRAAIGFACIAVAFTLIPIFAGARANARS